MEGETADVITLIPKAESAKAEQAQSLLDMLSDLAEKVLEGEITSIAIVVKYSNGNMSTRFEQGKDDTLHELVAGAVYLQDRLINQGKGNT